MHAISSVVSIFSTLIILAQSTTTCAHPLNQLSTTSSTSHQQLQPTDSLSPRACPNAITNPSFEALALSPWTAYYTGSWASHSSVAGDAYAGSRYFRAQSNSTNASTTTLSQSITLPASASVKCEAWVRANGRASIELFVGGVSCGERALVGTGQWARVGGSVDVGAGTKQVVIVGVVEGKVAVGVDGVWVGRGC